MGMVLAITTPTVLASRRRRAIGDRPGLRFRRVVMEGADMWTTGVRRRRIETEIATANENGTIWAHVDRRGSVARLLMDEAALRHRRTPTARATSLCRLIIDGLKA